MQGWDRYFDNAATTPVDPLVLAEMLPYLGDEFGNANSPHGWGSRARAAVERARQRVAEALGADDPSQVLFTSGSTESNNWVLRAFDGGLVGPFEHESVRAPAEDLGFTVLDNEGWDVKPASSGFISHMLVNNETGMHFDLSPLRANCRCLHSDITQAVGKVAEPLNSLDLASLSSHKVNGPKGVGALFVRDPASTPTPLLLGGEHEFGARAGTLNVAGIVGFGLACSLAEEHRAATWQHALTMRELVTETLGEVQDGEIHRMGVPHILAVSFLGLEGETVVLEMDARGYGIGSGAACSTGSTEPSHVLTALGIEPDWIRGTVRISFGRYNSKESSAALAANLVDVITRLRRLRN